MRMTDDEYMALMARRGNGLPPTVTTSAPTLTVRPRAFVMAVGRTARGVMKETDVRPIRAGASDQRG